MNTPPSNPVEAAQDKLLPCPFCGHKSPVVMQIRDGRHVACTCGAEGPPAYHGPADKPSAYDRAIAAWNHRPSPNPSEVAGLAERLKAELATYPLNGSFSNGSLADYSDCILDALRSIGVVERDGVERLRDILDTERYKVAAALQGIRKAIDSRRWLSEPGRGSYTYDDERYQQEFGQALDEIAAAIEPLRKIAGDWSDCPTDPLRVEANRSAALSAAQDTTEGDDEQKPKDTSYIDPVDPLP